MCIFFFFYNYHVYILIAKIFSQIIGRAKKSHYWRTFTIKNNIIIFSTIRTNTKKLQVDVIFRFSSTNNKLLIIKIHKSL